MTMISGLPLDEKLMMFFKACFVVILVLVCILLAICVFALIIWGINIVIETVNDIRREHDGRYRKQRH